MPSNRLPFTNAGYFFLAILAVALFGFVPSYFPEQSGREVHFSIYTHVHATAMVLWLSVLIAQPFLIKRAEFQWHRRLGYASYVLLPAVLVAALLMTHDWLNRDSELSESMRFYLGAKDIVIIGTMYTLAMYFRKIPAYHARLIVASSFQLLEPGLARSLRVVFSPKDGLFITWLIIDAALIYLIIRDRRLKRGKWIFRLGLAMTLSVQIFFLAGGLDTFYFQAVVSWFKALNLT